jgi:hypothetical protein
MERFMTLVNDYAIHWLEYDGTLWVPTREVSAAKGRHPTCYSTTWWKTPKAELLRGSQLFIKGEQLVKIRTLFKDKYSDMQAAGYRQQLLIEWIRAVDFFYYEEDSKTTPQEEVALLAGTIVVDSRFLAIKLNLSHAYLKRLVKKYEENFFQLGPLIKKEEVNSGELYYLFIEAQCYFLTSILSNKPEIIEFKVWMINHISSIKQINIKSSTAGEKLLQDKLIQLSSYCSVKVRSEITLSDTFSNKASSTRRVDLLIQDSIAVELKKEKITTSILTEVTGDKSYFDLLQQTFPSFKVLVICGPEGISDEAQRIINLMKPKVRFMSAKQLGSFLAEFILRETPRTGHWWLYNFIFPQFKEILLNNYLQPNERLYRTLKGF